MLTVPDAARQAGCASDTIRRWIRSGRLTAQKVGARYIIKEADLLDAIGHGQQELPERWRRAASGRPIPNVVSALHRSRAGR